MPTILFIASALVFYFSATLAFYLLAVSFYAYYTERTTS